MTSPAPPAPEAVASLDALLAQVETANRRGDTVAVATLVAEARERMAWGLPDRLTGLYKTDAVPLLEQRYPAQPGSTCAVLFVDLDGLKHVNDTRGHQAGDAYIRRAAQALRTACRARDAVVLHRSGDEFVVVGPGSRSEADAERLARRVHTALTQAGVPASVGWTRQHSGEGLEPAIRRADHAMYAVKAQHHAEERGWER